jgi:hypothetical protein
MSHYVLSVFPHPLRGWRLYGRLAEGNCGVYLLVPTQHVIQRWRLLKQNNRLPKIDRCIIIVVNVESYPTHLQEEIDIELEGNVLSSRKQPYSFLASVAC